MKLLTKTRFFLSIDCKSIGSSSLLFIIALVLWLCPSTLLADYRISGTINTKGAWQAQVFLSTIDRLDDYYNAKAEFIINVTSIDEEGSFVLEGDNLPEQAQFYKLYVLKESHSEFNACLYMQGEERNFIHLLLDNKSKVQLTADTTGYAPFGNYSITGNLANEQMTQLNHLLHPSQLFYEIKFPAELKYSQDKLSRDLFQFADTCSNTLVALAAINNTDYHLYFDTQYDLYQKIAQRMKLEWSDHPYTQNYIRKLRYYNEQEGRDYSLIFLVMTCMFAFLSAYLLFQNRQLKQQKNTPILPTPPAPKLDQLTPQEQKILHFIKAGKSNKEIAGELFIELSTVKSHINKLYAKIKVKSRKEAILLAKSQEIEGV